MTANGLLRVSAIRVRKLFGIYDHDVELNSADRLTIIHGPNGVGKTAFLGLTNSLLSGKYGDLAKTPFAEFWIEFSDGSRAGVSKTQSQQSADSVARDVRLYFEPSGGQRMLSSIASDFFDPQRVATQIERESPYLTPLAPGEWFDRRTEEVLSASEVVARYSEQLPEKMRNKLLKDLPQLKLIREQIKVHLIEAQRLIRLTTSKSDFRIRAAVDRAAVDTVQEYSRDLKKRISDALGTYAKESQRLDQSFPQRLLSPALDFQGGSNLGEAFKEIDDLRSKLKRLGLIDDSENGPYYPFSISREANLDATQQTALRLYVDDTRAKLATLEDLAQRLDVLLGNINKKFRNKELRISREKGLYALGPDRKESLSLSSLSSGEQHEIVLMYDLLFKVTKNTLVLLDEPELSLHVSWQKSFLADLASVIAIVEFDVLLATHSPYIVGDRADLMVELSTGESQLN